MPALDIERGPSLVKGSFNVPSSQKIVERNPLRCDCRILRELGAGNYSGECFNAPRLIGQTRDLHRLRHFLINEPRKKEGTGIPGLLFL